MAAQQYIESVGGKLHGFWYAFGDHDGYNLWEAPDNVSMAAVALAIGAGGALSSIRDHRPALGRGHVGGTGESAVGQVPAARHVSRASTSPSPRLARSVGLEARA